MILWLYDTPIFSPWDIKYTKSDKQFDKVDIPFYVFKNLLRAISHFEVGQNYL